MALLKAQVTEYGLNADYWKVSDFAMRPIQKQAIINLIGYFNTIARTSNRQPVATGQIVCDLDAFESKVAESGGVLKACYAWLKELPEFEGAEDV